MKKTVLMMIMGFAAIFAVTPSASAQLYLGGGVAVFQADAGPDEVELGAFMARAGFDLGPNFAVEAEGAIGLQDDDFTVAGTSYDVGIDNQVGGFAVAKAPLGPVDVFGRVGYANFSIDDDSPGSTAPDGSGLAYGGGLNFNILFIRARAEYTRYEVDEGEFDSLALSALFNF
jgi:hypothetical protein